MDYALLLVIIVFLGSLSLRGEDEFLSKEQTTSMNGLFVVLIFLSHFFNYAGNYDHSEIYASFQTLHGQLVVVPFFFFSGFGIMNSIINKGAGYIRSLGTKKAIKLLLHFDICVILFLVLNTFLGIDYSLLTKALSFLSIKSVGNSNWFITTTLIMYEVTALCFLHFKNRRDAIAAIAFFGLLYALLGIAADIPARFYTTALAFPIGMAVRNWFPEIEDMLENLRKHPACLAILLVTLPILSTVFSWPWPHRKTPIVHCLLYVVGTSSFICFMLLFLSIFSLRESVFKFCGKHVFSIYMMQRIPMIIIFQLGLFDSQLLPQIVLAALTTLALALLLEKVFEIGDKAIDSL